MELRQCNEFLAGVDIEPDVQERCKKVIEHGKKIWQMKSSARNMMAFGMTGIETVSLERSAAVVDSL